MRKEIFIKFLNNQCTEDELREIYHWIQSGALSKESMEWASEDWESFRNFDAIEDAERFENLFDTIRERIETDDKKHRIKNRSTTLFTWFSRVAAVLLIPVLGLLVYTLVLTKQESSYFAKLVSDTLEVISPYNSRTIVQLSDGSKVHLNYGSRLRYPHFFSDKSREVRLSGEGFFEVSSDPDKPFTVSIDGLNVKAVGTAFNVLGISEKNLIETTLVEGEVVLEARDGNHEVVQIDILRPGQHIKYNTQTGNKMITEGGIEKYIAWKDGKIVFEDTPLTEVTERLSRLYNVDFEISDKKKDYIYTFKTDIIPLYDVLDLMCIATPIHYTLVPRKKLPDGTYTKPKVIIK